MATKSAIGKMRQDALNRMVAAMQVFNDLFSLPPLHIDQIVYHDPAYQEAARLAALADWLDDLLDVVDAPDGKALRVYAVETSWPPAPAELAGV